jgi:hypothetical protein
MNREEVEERISKAQEYIDGMKLLYDFATTGEQKSQALTYWGFATMIKKSFELHLTTHIQEDIKEFSIKTQEQIAKEREREKTTDWMTHWLKDLANVRGEKS